MTPREVDALHPDEFAAMCAYAVRDQREQDRRARRAARHRRGR